MFFLGNLNSVHITTWFSIYQLSGLSYQGIYSVHPLKAHAQRAQKIFFLSKVLSYVLLGLYLSFKLSSKTVLHAHGASGYGLAALLSRKKFVVTVYGSEIFARHSYFYDLMMKCVFKKANVITVTSEDAKQTIVKKFNINPEKICHFHTGIKTELLDENKAPSDMWKPNSSFKCLSIRNTAPHYQTEHILKAFMSASSTNQLGENPHLIILLGNGDKNYFNGLKQKYSSNNISFIEQFLPPIEMHALISDSHVCINFPKTDQLSATLLEAIYYGKKIICSNIPSYQSLFTLAKEHSLPLTVVALDEIENALKEMNISYSNMENNGKEIIEKNYSQVSAAHFFKTFINEKSLLCH